MDSNLNEKLADVFREIIEQLAFMFAEPVEKAEVPGVSGDTLGIRMEFSGPFAGRLSLAASRSEGVEVAANILGLDSDDPSAQVRAEDALKEVLNVTCGRLLTELAGAEPVFQLTVPQSIPLDAQAWAAMLAADGTQAFDVDGNYVLLSVEVNSEG
ncbi:MAG: chemotaxis protein CheX [FCB group bacterium]|nr:chemotaxis protein CheX [FCB group bacterium]